MSRLSYYKATRLNGFDFRTATIDYARALETGEVIRHPLKMVRDDPATYLSVSIHPTNCTGMEWPCRLFRVEPTGRTLKANISDSKRSCSALRVVEELPAHVALGPQGAEVAALIERAGKLTTGEIYGLGAAWDVARRDAARRVAARGAAWDAARGAARDAADTAWDAAVRDAACAVRGAAWGDAARGTAWGTAVRGAAWGGAALALLTRDLISDEHFKALYGPWQRVIGAPVA